jgi:hypothetical protein
MGSGSGRKLGIETEKIHQHFHYLSQNEFDAIPAAGNHSQA